jgi:MFS family permease
MAVQSPAPAKVPDLPPLRQNRDFRFLMIGNSINDLGTAVGVITLTIVIYQYSKSALLVGTIDTVELIALDLCGTPAGWVADHYPRRQVMVAGAVLGFLSYGLLFGVVYTRATSIPWLIIPVVLAAAGSALYGACSRAVLPVLVSSQDIPNATTIVQARGALAVIVGAPIGGLLYSMHDWLPFGINAFSYLAALVLVLLIHGPMSPPGSREPGLPTLKSMFAGVDLILVDRKLRDISILGIMAEFSSTGFIMCLIVSLQQRHYSFAIVGSVQSACAFGMVVGAVVSPIILKQYGIGAFAKYALVLVAGSFAVVSVAAQSWLILVMLGVGCLFVIPLVSGLSSYQILAVPPELQGRVSSADQTLTRVSAALAPVLGGVIFGAFGYIAALLFFASLMALAGVYAGVSSVRKISLESAEES